MDIVVTIPKKELETVHKEDEVIAKSPKAYIQFWSMSKLPKNIEPGERVYFIENGMISYYHELMGMDTEDQYCEITDRTWPGPALILKCPKITLDNPVPMRGFQGFKYITKEEQGTWTQRKSG